MVVELLGKARTWGKDMKTPDLQIGYENLLSLNAEHTGDCVEAALAGAFAGSRLGQHWDYKDIVGGEHPVGDEVTAWIGLWMDQHFRDRAVGLSIAPWRQAQSERKQKLHEAQAMYDYDAKLLAGPSSVISCTADQDGPYPSSCGHAIGLWKCCV